MTRFLPASLLVFSLCAPVSSALSQATPLSCADSAAPRRPPVPLSFKFPSDTMLAVTDPQDTSATYFRDLVAISFADTASDRTVCVFFERFPGAIVGGDVLGEVYIYRFPDPGPSWQHFRATLDSMNATAPTSV